MCSNVNTSGLGVRCNAEYTGEILFWRTGLLQKVQKVLLMGCVDCLWSVALLRYHGVRFCCSSLFATVWHSAMGSIFLFSACSLRRIVYDNFLRYTHIWVGYMNFLFFSFLMGLASRASQRARYTAE